jgi:hypothetical protein
MNDDGEHYATFATLSETLFNETVQTLKRLAALVQPSRLPTRKTELVELLTEQLQGERLRNLWNQLDELQQAAVAETVYGQDSLFHADRFLAKYGTSPDWGERKGFSTHDAKPSLLGLFFYHGSIPDELKQRLINFVPEPTPTELHIVDDIPAFMEQEWEIWNPQTKSYETGTVEVPVIRRETERTAFYEFKAVLELIEAQEISVSEKTHTPTSAALKAIDKLLLNGDFYDDVTLAAESADQDYEAIGPIRAFAWPMLLQAGHLIEPAGRRLRLTAAGAKALQGPSEKALSALWQRWLKSRLFDELSRIDNVKGQAGRGRQGLTAVAPRRETLDAVLSICPTNHWIEVDELFRDMQANERDFEVTHDPWNLYVIDPNYGSLGHEGYHDWSILQARYALCVLFEYAATLGLIDVAYVVPHGARPNYQHIWGTDDFSFFSRYDGLLYIRINPLGAYCLGQADSYRAAPLAEEEATPQEPRLQVLPNLEIHASNNALSPVEAFLLDSYAKKVSDNVWQLDQVRLLEILEKGHSVAVLRELLETYSDQALPETVSRFLADMQDPSKRLRDLSAARLIECADAALARLLANDVATQGLCMLAGDRYLVVREDLAGQFRNALHKLGYTLT